MMKNGLARRILGDSTVRFLLVGGIIFFAYAQVQSSIQDNEVTRIVVQPEYLEAIVDNFSSKTLRSPTPREMEGLVQGAIANEVLYREAVKLHLADGDEFVRRRLMKKMEFILEGMVQVDQPDQYQLQSYIDANKEKFLKQERITFQHVFLVV